MLDEMLVLFVEGCQSWHDLVVAMIARNAEPMNASRMVNIKFCRGFGGQGLASLEKLDAFLVVSVKKFSNASAEIRTPDDQAAVYIPNFGGTLGRKTVVKSARSSGGGIGALTSI